MQVLDNNVISELREMLEDEVDELFDELMQQVPQELAAMSACATARDLKSIEHKVHQIKGSSSNLGVMAFSEACRELEEGLRKGEISDPVPYIAGLNESFEQAVNEIKAMVKA